MNRKITPLVTLLLLICSMLQAQTADEKQVGDAIAKLFKAMELGDSAMARQVFADKVTTARVVKDKTGKTVLQQEEGISGFLKAIGSPHKDVWYEEIWNLKVQVDGDFAQAWCDFAFYAGKNFSHCGVDALQLVRDEKGNWRIFHLADTNRRTGCDIPKDIQAKHQ